MRNLTYAQIANHVGNYNAANPISQMSIDERMAKLKACVIAARRNPNTTEAQMATLKAQWVELKREAGLE